VVIRALELTQKGMVNYTQMVPADIKIQDLQNTTLLGTSHILRKALTIK